MENRSKYEEYIYKIITFKMSDRQMADLMYCLIMSHSNEIKTHGIGIYAYNRKQNRYNQCQVLIHIHPSYLYIFEEYGFKITEPIQLNIN